jgi:hypothetical protein
MTQQPITFRDILLGLQDMTDAELDCTATVVDVSTQEAYPVLGAGNVSEGGFLRDAPDSESVDHDFSEYEDVLGGSHPVIAIRA